MGRLAERRRRSIGPADAAAGFARVGVERGIESNLGASDERVELGLALEIAVGVARRGVGGVGDGRGRGGSRKRARRRSRRARGGGARAGRGAIVGRREGRGRLRRGLEGVVDVQARRGGIRSTRRSASFTSAFLRASVASTRRSKSTSWVYTADAGSATEVLFSGARRCACCCSLRFLPRPPRAGRVAELGAHHAGPVEAARARGCVARGGEETHT